MAPNKQKIDDIMYHVKGDFFGAPGLWWDLRLRPDHLTVVTVRLKDAPAHLTEKSSLEYAADVLAFLVT